MTKILSLSYMRYRPSGVLNQIRWEADAAREIGLDFSSILALPDTEKWAGEDPESIEYIKIRKPSSLRFFDWISERRAYAKFIVKKSQSVDLIVVRWSVADPFLYLALRKAKKPIFTVHHTNEEAELRLSARFGKIRARIDRFVFSRSSSIINGVIAVTGEIAKNEISRSVRNLPTFIYSNGIYIDGNVELQGKISQGEVIKIVFVSSYFAEWQGLDLLLDSMTNKYNGFELHLAGDMSEDLKQRVMADKRVVYHGLLEKKGLQDLYLSCDVGLSAFALDRKGMQQAATLKVREYLRYGLPVYSGHDDVFPSSFKYYKNGPPTIEDILLFAREHAGTNRLEVFSESRPYIDKVELLRNLHTWLISSSRT